MGQTVSQELIQISGFLRAVLDFLWKPLLSVFRNGLIVPVFVIHYEPCLVPRTGKMGSLRHHWKATNCGLWRASSFLSIQLKGDDEEGRKAVGEQAESVLGRAPGLLTSLHRILPKARLAVTASQRRPVEYNQ